MKPMKLFPVEISVLCLASALFAQQPAPPSLANPLSKESKLKLPPDAVVLTVGTQKVTRAQFEELLAALAQNGRAATTPAAKRQVADQIGEIMALAQEARKRKMDQDPSVQQIITIQTDQILANSLARHVSSELKVDDAALHAYYDHHKDDFEQAKANHILIRFKGSRVPLKPNQKDLTEEEALAKAQDLRKQLLAGGDFAAIAKAESDDTGSATNGGSLGPASGRGKFVPQFEQVEFTIPVGQISEPVKTPFGYHIIKVEERTAKSFDESKAEVEKKIRPEKTKEAMDKIHKDAQVTLDDNYF